MNELKAKLAVLGLSDEVAEKAIHIVGDFAKAKLPASLHAMIDDVLAGKSPDLGKLGKLGGLLGGFFGGR